MTVNKSFASRFFGMFKNLFSNMPELTYEYTVKILDTTKLETNDGKVALLEELSIGETI